MFQSRSYSNRVRLILMSIGVLALTSLACGLPSGQTQTENEQIDEPAEEPVEEATEEATEAPPPQGSDVASLTINNDSLFTICYVYISPSTESEWGEDQLGQENVILSGGSFTINNIPTGTYDLLARTCSDDDIAQQNAVELPVGDFTWDFTVEPSALTTLSIINNSTATTVCYVYISLSSSSEWGADQLGQENVVAPGATFTISEIPAGTYDLKAEDCEHNSLGEQAHIDMTAGETTEWTFTDN